jgi:thiol:disulfide interchange protein
MQSMQVLRLTLAAVLGAQAAWLLATAPPPTLVALAVAELAAAALFVIPRTLRFGAAAVVVVLIAACALHLHVGEPPPPAYAIYLAAIWAIVRQPSPRAS